ncbi:MAG: hypothetical protein ACKV2O_06725 [Acidimicrobiales bacterium]
MAVSVDGAGFEPDAVVELIRRFSLLDDDGWDDLAATAEPLPCPAVRLGPTTLPERFVRDVVHIEEPACTSGASSRPSLTMTLWRRDPPAFLTVSVQPFSHPWAPTGTVQTVGRRLGVGVETGEGPGLNGMTATTVVTFIDNGQFVKVQGWFTLEPEIIDILDSIGPLNNEQWQQLKDEPTPG